MSYYASLLITLFLAVFPKKKEKKKRITCNSLWCYKTQIRYTVFIEKICEHYVPIFTYYVYDFNNIVYGQLSTM